MATEQQSTEVRKKDKALLAAVGVFTLAMVCIAILGILLIKPPKDTIQGQADCDVVRVSGKLPGRVVKFYVHEGDYVHKGDTLVSIYSKTVDASLYKARSMQSAAASQSQKVDRGTRDELKRTAANAVQQAQAAEGIARKTYERMENLFKQGVVSEQKRDEAKAAYEAASAAVRTAKSQLDLAQNGAQSEDKSASRSLVDAARGTVMEVESLLEDQYLIAPCDGEVSEIFPHEGELVSLGTPIMSISKLSDMWVAFNVREEKLAELGMGKEVSVTIPALNNMATKLRIYYVHDMGSYAVWSATKAYGQYDSKTFEIKARPVKPIEGFRPGMSVLLDD
ncbi:MAG: efflux RND transporter periplasmic adaptor subunit [Bacteroidales bacterium]|nr:efflux RND transporter periplasmic adaptor subunit [Bacteroidales bacterium]